MVPAPPGTPPGSLVAGPDARESTISVIAYSADDILEETINDTARLKELSGKWDVLWVNVVGFADVAAISRVGEIFGIHELALEDALTLSNRAKLEIYGDRYFMVAHMVELAEGAVSIEQVSMFFGEGIVVTFQDAPFGLFGHVRERIRKKQGKIRSAGADYLTYRLLDAIIDAYFPVLETLGERLDGMEEEILERPSRNSVTQVHDIKRDLLALRRTIWPMREAVGTLLREHMDACDASTLLFLRDCHDHAVQIAELIENYREIGSDLMDVYLSSLSNRLNEVMKVLTIITTICAPPTLIAGIYGMNFRTDLSPFNMPELTWRFGYFFSLFLMVTLAVVTFVMVRGWLKTETDSRGKI